MDNKISLENDCNENILTCKSDQKTRYIKEDPSPNNIH